MTVYLVAKLDSGYDGVGMVVAAVAEFRQDAEEALRLVRKMDTYLKKVYDKDMAAAYSVLEGLDLSSLPYAASIKASTPYWAFDGFSIIEVEPGFSVPVPEEPTP